MGRAVPDIMMRIREVGDVTPGGGVRVTFADGKTACLPIDACDWIPGAVVVPAWLAKRIEPQRREGREEGCVKGYLAQRRGDAEKT